MLGTGCRFSREDVGLSGEEARNIIKNVSMNALSRQRVFQDAASVVSDPIPAPSPWEATGLGVTQEKA